MKKGWIVLAAALLVACVCPTLPALVPKGNRNQSTQTRPAARSSNHASSPTSGDFSRVRLFPEDGNLEEQLQVEAGKARTLGQHMFVEFDASW